MRYQILILFLVGLSTVAQAELGGASVSTSLTSVAGSAVVRKAVVEERIDQLLDDADKARGEKDPERESEIYDEIEALVRNTTAIDEATRKNAEHAVQNKTLSGQNTNGSADKAAIDRQYNTAAKTSTRLPTPKPLVARPPTGRPVAQQCGGRCSGGGGHSSGFDAGIGLLAVGGLLAGGLVAASVLGSRDGDRSDQRVEQSASRTEGPVDSQVVDLSKVSRADEPSQEDEILALLRSIRESKKPKETSIPEPVSKAPPKGENPKPRPLPSGSFALGDKPQVSGKRPPSTWRRQPRFSSAPRTRP